MLKQYILLLLLFSLSIFSCKNNCEQSYQDGFKAGFVAAQQNGNKRIETTTSTERKSRNKNYTDDNKSANDNLSPKEVLQYVLKHKEAPAGYVGGREFKNYENLLPKNDNAGNKINYQEWDVHPKQNGRNRGAERLVTGSDGNAYFTKNHYKSFEPIRPE
jgi:ribonuclease T1